MFPFKKKSPLQKIGFGLLSLVGIFIIILLASFSTQLIAPHFNQNISAVVTNKEDAFNVHGEASVETEPDEAQINLGVESQATTVKEAQDQMNTVINQLTANLQTLGIENQKIQTTDYSIYPNYDYSDSGQGQIIGYRASTSVNITVTDFNLLNQAIDSATQSGVNQIYGISFTLSEDKQAQVKKDARTQAIQNAKDNAQELASLTGMQLGKIIDVQENTSSSSMPYNSMAKALAFDSSMGGSSESATGVNPGSTSYTYSVTLSYQTK